MGQKTAIDWLVEEVNKDCHISAFIPHDLVEQAKQMEKEQSKRDYYAGLEGYIVKDGGFERYYKVTYGE